MLTTQGVVLAAAMAVSAGTIILFDLFREKNRSSDDIKALKPCLSSGRKRKQKKEKNKVRFADEVKDLTGGIQICDVMKEEIVGHQGMPSNRAALYKGILKDRVQRMMEY